MASPPVAEEGNDNLGPEISMQRTRWATRKMTVKSGTKKRLSLIGRKQHNRTASEKKRASGGAGSLQQPGEAVPEEEEVDTQSESAHDEGGPAPRQLYFGQPLPRELQDEEGKPARQFTRNKIRTAKYTPLSFIPKNLFFQFHNVANIFFLFIVILVVSGPWVRLGGQRFRCHR